MYVNAKTKSTIDGQAQELSDSVYYDFDFECVVNLEM